MNREQLLFRSPGLLAMCLDHPAGQPHTGSPSERGRHLSLLVQRGAGWVNPGWHMDSGK